MRLGRPHSKVRDDSPINRRTDFSLSSSDLNKVGLKCDMEAYVERGFKPNRGLMMGWRPGPSQP